MELDVMSTQEGHKKMDYKTVQEFEQDNATIDDIFSKLQKGWLLSVGLSDGTTQLVANKETSKQEIKQIVRQMNPQKLLLKPAITAG